MSFYLIMNNSFVQLKTAAAGLFKAKQSAVRTNQLHPKRDWLIGIGIALLIVVALAGWNTFSYLENRNGGNPDDITIETTPPVYNAAWVEQAHTIVAERAAVFAALEGQASITNEIIEDAAAPATTTASSTAEQSDAMTTTDSEQIEGESAEDSAEVATDETVEPAEESTTQAQEPKDTTEPIDTPTEDNESEPVESDDAPELSV